MYLLGRIESPSGVARSNVQTGASGAPAFTINSAQKIYLVPDVTGVLWEMGVASGFNTSPTRAAPLELGKLNGPFPAATSTPIVSVVLVTGGANVKVYGGPRS